MFDVYYSFSAKAPVGAYPLWTGETITNCKSLFPTFWKELRQLAENNQVPTVTSEEYDSKIEKYGQCSSFYIDSLNGHVRLPKITKFISSITDLGELAEEENDGLPDIEGSFNVNGRSNISTNDGAIYTKETGINFIGTNGGFSAASVVGFKASKSNEKYGASQDVTPKNVKLCLYLQVANNSADIALMDTSVIAQQLADAIAQIEEITTGKEAEISQAVSDGVDRISQEVNSNITEITKEGEKQVAAVIAAGSGITDEGTEQVALVVAEGDKQVKRVSDIGDNLQQIGDEQVNRIETVVEEEVDKKLPEIVAAVNTVIAEGEKQTALVAAEGANQTQAFDANATAKTQAFDSNYTTKLDTFNTNAAEKQTAVDAAASAAAASATSAAESATASAASAQQAANIVVNSLYYVRKSGNTSAVVLEDGKTFYPLTISENSSITFDASGLSKAGDIIFHMDIKLENLVSVDFSSANVFGWLNDNEPDLSDISKHVLLGFMSTDNGASWLGSVEGTYTDVAAE